MVYSVYKHKLVYEKNNLKNGDFFQILEDISLVSDNSFILCFINNQFREVIISSNESFNPLKPNQNIYFTVKGVLVFFMKLNSNIINFRLYKDGNISLLKYWLYHTFLPIIFTLKNKYYFLHAGSIIINEKAVLFVAKSFGGKSTLTNSFIEKGHTLISDDKVALEKNKNKFFAVPSYPYNRPYRNVEDLGIYRNNFSDKSIPINCVYNLIKTNANEEVKITEVSGIEKFTVLKLATDIDSYINRKEQFEKLCEIANTLKVYNIKIPWSLSKLNDVYNTIIIHNNSIKKDN